MLTGNNAELLEELYLRYLENPGSVGPEWAGYFAHIDNGSAPPRVSSPPSAHVNNHVNEPINDRGLTPAGSTSGMAGIKEVGVQKLRESYRRNGHLAARLDPLGIRVPDRHALELREHNLDEGDLDSVFDSRIPNLGRTTLRNMIDWFEKTYCGSIGAEHFYLADDEERNWLQRIMEETANNAPLTLAERLRLFEKVYQAEYFEKFLAQKYVGKKRFSMEGGESLIALLDTVTEEAGRFDMDHLVLGMAHRGRLNVLVNLLQKPAGVVFAEFDENYDPDTIDYADVKYHLGFSSEVMTRATKEVKLTLAFNPSHLEAVDPVIMGSIRARQTLNQDRDRSKFMPIMIHGDAAFPGQGVVAETLNLMNLEGYSIGGTLHIVCNNQIGFTTLPEESRSTLYATDLAKGFQVPIFHVNGDDPEAVFRVVKLAMEFRQRYHKDVVIDLICYRRLGHNETDEPSFTQPRMYARIKKHPTPATVYAKRLLEYDDVTQEDIEFIRNGTRAGLERSFQRAKDKNIQMTVDTMRGKWADFSMEPLDSEPQTKLLGMQLIEVVEALTTVPEGFNIHPKLKRFIDTRVKMFEGETLIDWGFAEALAFGSILENGYNIRLSGQDSQRGTFSHRHAVMTDVETGATWTPLNGISENQGNLEVVNAPLSEYAVLGFDYGYSLADPKSLVIWEAQFGDFANSAQIMIDQFITCSEVKWYRMSGLVMLLPHGYEGQGPEHSSARLERFLQLCASNNIQVCNCTTPAQYFHLLRRQELRSYRKPLVIMTPKSLLRLPEAGSTLSDISRGIFREVLRDRRIEKPENVRRMAICSGKIYYDLLKRRTEKELTDVALIRMEQLYPFPDTQFNEILELYPNVKEYIWVQEEPENMGAWFYVESRINQTLGKRGEVRCISRKESPSPSAGMVSVHKKEQGEIVDRALGLS